MEAEQDGVQATVPNMSGGAGKIVTQYKDGEWGSVRGTEG